MNRFKNMGLYKITFTFFLFLVAISCKDESDIKRPQEPEKPYPYHVEEVKIRNSEAGLTLSGTLTIPRNLNNKRFPAVILITGSDPQDRDETYAGHKPFLVISDYFTRHGIAVLRYDDRGFGKSTGDYHSSSLIDFSKDVKSAISFLKTRPKINPNKIGLVGHSEGGLVGAITASKSDEVSFLVMLAGPGQPYEELLLLQHEMMSKAKGFPQDKIEKCLKIDKKLIEMVKSSTNVELLKKQIKNYLKANYNDYHFIVNAKNNLEEEINEEVEFFTSAATIDELKNYTPSTFLKEVECPVLALGGSKDLNVPSKENIELIRKALKEGGNHDITAEIFPNLNHSFQESKTGLPSEVEQIKQTISPLVLEEMTNWIIMQSQ